jgi:hypothetical protein
MKIKFGSFVVAGSGKVGGHVAATNRGGAYLRTKVTPLNPNTASQAQTRSLLASLSTAWAGLTDDQRKSWNGAVASFAKTDIFGDLRNPSGINLFVKLNANLSNSGQSLLTEAPEKVEVPFSSITLCGGSISADSMLVTFANVGLNGSICKISATPAMSQGVNFVKSQLRVIGYLEIDNEEIDVWAQYVAKFGEPTAGQNIVISVAPITATGQQGVAQNAKAVMIA